MTIPSLEISAHFIIICNNCPNPSHFRLKIFKSHTQNPKTPSPNSYAQHHQTKTPPKPFWMPPWSLRALPYPVHTNQEWEQTLSMFLPSCWFSPKPRKSRSYLPSPKCTWSLLCGTLCMSRQGGGQGRWSHVRGWTARLEEGCFWLTLLLRFCILSYQPTTVMILQRRCVVVDDGEVRPCWRRLLVSFITINPRMQVEPNRLFDMHCCILSTEE